jgi:DNA primase
MISFNDKKTILSILQSELGSYQRTTDDNYKFHCPFCNHRKKKLEIHVATQKWQCWVCGTGGRTLSSLLYKSNGSSENKRRLKDILNDQTTITPTDVLDTLFNKNEVQKDKIHITLPDGFIPLWNISTSNDPLIRKALWYLKNRNITKSHILKYNIGVCGSGRWADMIIVPSYDKNGDLNYFIGRTLHTDSFIKYSNPNISKNVILFENQINWNLPVVLCEGVFDAISIGRNAIPTLGMNLPEKLRTELFNRNVKHIYFAYDKETKAVEKSIKLATFFKRNGIKVTHLNLPDKDPSDVGFVGMTSIIKNSTPTEWDDMIKTSLNFL